MEEEIEREFKFPIWMVKDSEDRDTLLLFVECDDAECHHGNHHWTIAYIDEAEERLQVCAEVADPGVMSAFFAGMEKWPDARLATPDELLNVAPILHKYSLIFLAADERQP